jgi:hypothetical protein
MVRMVNIDSRARPLVCCKDADHIRSCAGSQCSHGTPRHHPVYDISCMPKSTRDSKVKAPFLGGKRNTYFLPNGTPNAKLRREYINYACYALADPREDELKKPHGYEEVECDRPYQADKDKGPQRQTSSEAGVSASRRKLVLS